MDQDGKLSIISWIKIVNDIQLTEIVLFARTAICTWVAFSLPLNNWSMPNFNQELEDINNYIEKHTVFIGWLFICLSE